MWGFSVEAELIENADRQDELCCYVSRVEDKSVAMQNGKPDCHKEAGQATVIPLIPLHISAASLQASLKVMKSL